jgi:hypothetical protein
MNKEQEELLSDAYKNYTQTKIVKNDDGTEIHISPAGHYNRLSKEDFIKKIKTDNEFAKQCGVVYEERKLSEEERIEMIRPYGMDALIRKVREIWMEENNVPKLAISITYNNKTIESYEQRTKRVIK